MTEIQPKRRKIYRVKNARYIKLDDDAEGEYWVYRNRDGSYTVLPCPSAPPLNEMKVLDKIEPIAVPVLKEKKPEEKDDTAL